MERSGKVDLNDKTFGNITQLNSESSGESGVVRESVEFQEIPLEDVIGEILDSPTILSTENRQSESCGNDQRNQQIPETSRRPQTGNQNVTGHDGNNRDQDTNSEDSVATGLLREIDRVLKKPEESSVIPKQQQKEAIKQSNENEVNDAEVGRKYHGEPRRSSFGYHDGPDEEVSLVLFSDEVPKRRRDSLGDFTVNPNKLLDNQDVSVGAADKGDDCAELEVGIDVEFGDAGGNVKVEKIEVKGESVENARAEIPEVGDIEDQQKMPQIAGQEDRDEQTWNEQQIGECNGNGANRSNAAHNPVNNDADENGQTESSGDESDQAVQNGENQEQDIREDIVILPEAQDSTYIEAWSAFGMGLGVMPFRITRSGLTSETRGEIWNKVLWGISTAILIIKMANLIPNSIVTFKQIDSTSSLLKLGGYFGFVLTICAFWRAISLKDKCLLNANNRVDHSSYKMCKLSKKGKVIFLATLAAIVVVNTSLHIFYETKNAAQNYDDVKLKDAFNMLECLGQEYLTWNVNNCHQSPYLSNSNVIWSLVGFTVLSHSIIMETVIILGIIICCGVFFLATYETRSKQSATENPADVTEGDYANLSELAEELSKFIGECIVGYLTFHSMKTPGLIKALFMGSFFVFLSTAIKQGAIFVGLVSAAASSLCMKKIGEKLVRREAGQPRLVGSARVRAFVSEMLFKKSIGIGYPGLFVITFPFLFSYLGFLLGSSRGPSA